MKMNTSIEWLLSFVIPEETSSLEEQIATLKRTLSKLDTWEAARTDIDFKVMSDVSSGMLKYMQSLDSPENQHRKEYILDALTVTELEGLLSLVEHAKEQLETQESVRSALLSRSGKTTYGGIHPGASPFPPLSSGVIGGLSPGIVSAAGVVGGLSPAAKDLYEQEKVKLKQWNALMKKYDMPQSNNTKE